MQDDIASPSYDDLNHALQHANVHTSAAEAHGILCGFICAGKDMDGQSWIELILGNQSIPDEILKKNKVLLLSLYEVSSIKLQQIEFDFSLLLPDDEALLASRLEALSHWCQGFLIAFEHCGITASNRRTILSEDTQEALNSMLTLSKINNDITEVTEEDEVDYFEIVEYLRISVLMIYTEMAAEQTSSSGERSNGERLH